MSVDDAPGYFRILILISAFLFNPFSCQEKTVLYGLYSLSSKQISNMKRKQSITSQKLPIPLPRQMQRKTTKVVMQITFIRLIPFDLYRRLTVATTTNSKNLGYMKLAILKLDEFIDKSFINKTVLRYSSVHLYYNVTSLSTSHSKVANVERSQL